MLVALNKLIISSFHICERQRSESLSREQKYDSVSDHLWLLCGFLIKCMACPRSPLQSCGTHFRWGLTLWIRGSPGALTRKPMHNTESNLKSFECRSTFLLVLMTVLSAYSQWAWRHEHTVVLSSLSNQEQLSLCELSELANRCNSIQKDISSLNVYSR